MLLPNQRWVIELTAILLPVAACVIRLVVGRHYILNNHCSRGFRVLQTALLILGLLVMGLVDCVITLMHIMPQRPQFVGPKDFIVWGALGVIYLCSMIVAMYPGKATVEKPKF